jgi:2-succinyl-5-enolpyruvyl-6-hydroxy-3-cyclohexene-1-carboxylate synthase
VLADQICFLLEQQPHPFVQMWEELLAKIRQQATDYLPAYSEMAAVKYFESQFPLHSERSGVESVHYANSTAIRLANIFARHPVYCNRGVNGIEGSLSTAAGFSCVTEEKVFCVIGDLSFFYDQNALWNQNLRGNLRILLLNNGRGGIFNQLRGLEQSPARDSLVAASHQTSAEGICHQNHVAYQKATDMDSMQQGIRWLLQTKSEHPLLLEVLTDVNEDERVMKDHYNEQKPEGGH